MVKNEISSAFEILLEEIENIIEELNQEGARQFSLSDHKKARSVLEKAESMTVFRGKIKDLQNEWHSLETHVSSTTTIIPKPLKHRKKTKLQRGLRTPEEEFRTPILETLKQLGGSASANDILARVGKMMAESLNEYDKQPLPSTPSCPRWRNTAQWTRNALVNEGFMAKDSPKGIWELADAKRRSTPKSETAWNETPLFSNGTAPKVLQDILQVYRLVKNGKVGYNGSVRQIAKDQGLKSIHTIYDACTRRINLSTVQFLELLKDDRRLETHLLATFPEHESYIKELFAS